MDEGRGRERWMKEGGGRDGERKGVKKGVSACRITLQT